jgi:hypothetical protein
LPIRELAQEQTEAADSKANAHQAEASSNPGEKRPLRGEVNARILFRWVVHPAIVARPIMGVRSMGALFSG